MPVLVKKLNVEEAAREGARLAGSLCIEDDVKRRRYNSERERKDMSAVDQAKLDEEWKWHNAQPMEDVYDLGDRDGNEWHDVTKRPQDPDVNEYLTLPATSSRSSSTSE